MSDEISTLIFESGLQLKVGKDRRTIQRELSTTPEDCQWFEYKTCKGEKISVRRKKIVAVKQGVDSDE